MTLLKCCVQADIQPSFSRSVVDVVFEFFCNTLDCPTKSLTTYTFNWSWYSQNTELSFAIVRPLNRIRPKKWSTSSLWLKWSRRCSRIELGKEVTDDGKSWGTSERKTGLCSKSFNASSSNSKNLQALQLNPKLRKITVPTVQLIRPSQNTMSEWREEVTKHRPIGTQPTQQNCKRDQKTKL